MNYVHLNVHSNFSLLNGIIPVEKLAAKVAGMGMSMVALTDTNGLYAAVPFMKSCQEHGIRPIFGTELKKDNHRAVLLAKNRAGYSEICRIITDLHLEEDKFKIMESIPGLSDNVFMLTDDEALLEKVHGRSNVFVEVTHFGDVASRQRLFHLQSVARKLGLQIVATNKVHFLESGDFKIHQVVNAIRTNSTIGTLAPSEHAHPESWLKPPGTIVQLFQQVPEAVANTGTIAWECDVDLELGRIKPPRFAVPPGEIPFSYLCKFRDTLTPSRMQEDIVFSRASDNEPYREHVRKW